MVDLNATQAENTELLHEIGFLYAEFNCTYGYRRLGDEYDVGFWGVLKCEMYYLRRFEGYETRSKAIEDFIYFYNHRRRQHALKKLAPVDHRALFKAVA